MLAENMNTDIPVAIHISSEHEVFVSITAPFLSDNALREFTLNPGQGKKVTIAPRIRMPKNSTVRQQSVLIQTTKPVSVILINDGTTNFDAAQLMEMDVLGMDYVVLSYIRTGNEGFFGVAVPFNETTLNIRVPARVNPIDVFVNGQAVSTHPELTLTLMAYDAVQILSSDDLSGTVISSDKKIAVFSGNARTNTFGVCYDFLMEQMPKASDLGYEYVIFSPYPGSDRDGFRTVSTAVNTSITFNGVTALQIQNEFDVDQQRLSRGRVMHIQSTQPLLVGGISFSGVKTDASLWLVDPVPYRGYKYVFTVPRGTVTELPVSYRLAITIEDGQQPFLLLDGTPLTGSTWKTSAGSSYTAAFVPVTHGPRTRILEHANAVGFGAALFSYSRCNSYSLKLHSFSPPKV